MGDAPPDDGPSIPLVNHLADETSPYLRQHADNPVEWFPWGDEALRRAREEDKPIFLSIGYASCHWCHVMAHESFEDPATAADLSRWFVSVKVDREERPDLDTVYMTATVALTGSGGWPMSVFCTPDGRPFYAGTYFPPEERHGMPAFRRVVRALGEAWVNERAQVLEQADALVGAVRRELRLAETLHEAPAEGAKASTPLIGVGGAPALDADALVAQVVAGLGAGFDPEWGGFGPAPKFPRPTLVELCLRRAAHGGSDAEHARHMAVRTLDAMAAGGIYDHLVGGFCRYSTDARWLVPHFEKMLTDQALLGRAYLHAWQATGHGDYLRVVTETMDWVLRDLSTPEGALYSSFDADAGGVEGGHATFTPDELRQLLPAALVGPAADVVRDHRGGQLGGPVHPGAPSRGAAGTPRRGGGGQVHPGRGPGPSGPARPGREGADRVERDGGGDFGRSRVGHRDRRLRRSGPRRSANSSCRPWTSTAASCAAGRADGLGIWPWRPTTPGWSKPAYACRSGRAGPCGGTGRWAWSPSCSTCSGTTSPAASTRRASDAEALVVRPKEFLDGAVPATNSIAVAALLRANAFADDPRLDRAVERTIALAGPLLGRHPAALADLVAALPMWSGRHEVVVTGDRPDLLAEVRRHWLPAAVVAWGEPDRGPLFEGRPAEPGLAYVCQARSCRTPAADVETLAGQLEALTA